MPTPTTSPISLPFASDFDQIYARLRNGLTKNARRYDWRIQQLHALRRMLEENDKRFSQAMWRDLRKSEFECAATEQGIVLDEIRLALKRLKRWMKDERVSTPIYNQPGRSRIVREPYGLTLIIGAWNYPINLLLAPLVGAICGGNGALLKPSEMAPHTADVIADLVPKYLDRDLFAVVQGGPDETSLVLSKPFDLIFFTGSGTVGKIILAKAAPFLTPVTLELGGKSPAIIWKDVDIKVAARRIAWGKFLNAGQTCIAPDYLILHPEIREPFLKELGRSAVEFYGHDAKLSPDYCRVINTKNYDRLDKLMSGLKIIHGGQKDRDDLFIAPTVVEATAESTIMQEEIFGPILPFLTMEKIEDVIAFIRERPKPLALYLFTTDPMVKRQVTAQTSSGAVLINDAILHMPVPTLPFGGVGPSGMGHYHGRFGFKTFTHAKAVLSKTSWFDVSFRYPPYNDTKAKLLKWIFR